MDWLEMRQEAAMQETDRKVAEAVSEFNKHPIGVSVQDIHTKEVSETTSAAYSKWPIAVVDIKGKKEVPLYRLKVLEK